MMKLLAMKLKGSRQALFLKISRTIGAVPTVVPQKRTMSSMKISHQAHNNDRLIRQEVISS
ncbi:MAG: hypothetical protein AOY29_07350 [Alcanivorax borkumensis]|nr:hypothetical protein Y017_07500 [Alcanivorax sp. 97CO-5]OJH09110.1 MAG: hypothetical protein AOY29_07350 [Alcanivorax borkumensis]